MTAISASSVAVKTMADNTLRITFDIEPRHAKAAFALFGERGTPVALAALKVGTQVESEPDQAPTKGGTLAKWAALRCKEDRFRDWLIARTEEEAIRLIKEICRIDSRAELDGNEAAAYLFKTNIMQPYANHCREKGWTE